MGRERAFEPDTDSEEHRVPKAARERDSPAADAIVSQALIDAVRVSHAAGQTRLPLQPSQILALQATRGNEFVQRRLRSGAAPEAVEPAEVQPPGSVGRLLGDSQLMRSLPGISRVPLLNAEARIAVLNWQLLVAKPLLQAAAIMRVSPYAAWALAKSAESGIELMLAQIDSVPDHLVGMVHSAIGRIRTATVMVEPFAGVTRTEEEVAAELSSAFTVASVTGVAMQVAVDLGSPFGGASP